MVIIARELAVTMLRMGASHRGVIGATWLGKLKTAVQIATILAIIAVQGHPLWLSAADLRDGRGHRDLGPRLLLRPAMKVQKVPLCAGSL